MIDIPREVNALIGNYFRFKKEGAPEFDDHIFDLCNAIYTLGQRIRDEERADNEESIKALRKLFEEFVEPIIECWEEGDPSNSFEEYFNIRDLLNRLNPKEAMSTKEGK